MVDGSAIRTEGDSMSTYVVHPVRCIISLEQFDIHKLTNLMIRPADVQRPVMLWSDNDSVLRDILPMGQDPRCRTLTHPVVVLFSADLSVLLPVIPRPVAHALLLNVTTFVSGACLRQGRKRKTRTSSSTLSWCFLMPYAAPATPRAPKTAPPT